MLRPLLLASALLLTGCAGALPSAMPASPAYVVSVKSVRIPSTEPWITRFAYHTWLDLKKGSDTSWERMEILSAESGVLIYSIPDAEARADTRWTNPVQVVGLVTGDEAQKMIPSLEDQARNYADRANYAAYPGPNSNTFTARLALATPDLHLTFNPNAVGKDYTPWLYAGPTVTGTGLQLDTLPLGLQLGLRDGLQLHFIQLTFGISLFPPAIELPIIPRIGMPPRGF